MQLTVFSPRRRAPVAPLIGSIVASILLCGLVLLVAPFLRTGLARIATPAPGLVAPHGADEAARQVPPLSSPASRGPHLIISTTENRFWLMSGTRVLREGIGSTGSYVQLVGSDGRTWLFESPRGVHRIQRKTQNPVWTKPDWAFVEAGLPVPPYGSPERIERGVLGRYSLALGDGYLIHGTPYQRLLGLPVTHGCVRLGDADLEVVYHTLPVGAPVFIY